MKKTGIIILMVLAAALAIGTFLLIRTPEKTADVTENEVSETETFLVKTVEEDIVKLTLENEEGIFLFEKKDGRWMMVFDELIEVSGNAIVSLEAIAKSTLAVDEIEKDASDFGIYGLGNPVAVLSYETESGEKGFIKIGNLIANQKSYFTVDNKNVYTMELYDSGLFFAGMKAFVNMNIFAADIQYITKVKIVNGENVLIMEKDDQTIYGYAIKSPVRENASDKGIQKLLQAVTGIDASYYNPQINDEEAGFKESTKSFSVTASEKEEIFVIGNTVGKDDVYLKKEGVKGAYIVPLSVLEFTDYTAFDLVDKHIAIYHIDDVTSIMIESSGEIYDITLGTNKTLNGKNVDEEKMKDFYAILVGLSYAGSVSEDFSSEGIKADVTITFYRNGKRDVTEYVPYDAMSYAVRRNGVAEFTIQRKYVDRVVSIIREM